MVKQERMRAIRRIISEESIDRQERIVERLEREGFKVTQSSVSRDLAELGVEKSNGQYVLTTRPGNVGILSGAKAGPNLLVVRTDVGAANLVALKIDQMRMPEVVGTLAGDDTIFIATASSAAQAAVIARLGVPNV